MGTHRAKSAIAIIVSCACAVAVTFAVASHPYAPVAPAASVAPASGSETVPATSANAPESATPASAGDLNTPKAASAAAPGDDPSAYEPGCVLITLADGVTPEQAQAAIEAADGLDGASVRQDDGSSIVQLALPDGLAVERAIDLLDPIAQIAAAQPNYRYYIQEATLPDPTRANASLARAASASANRLVAGTALGNALGVQATADDPAYTQNRLWALASVKAPAAWDAVKANAAATSSVTVAVIDNGFLATHEDLALHVVDTYDAAKETAKLASDNSDHGTHVAGIVGAVNNNGVGVASVTNNAVGLMLVRVTDSKGLITTTTVADAYDYIVKNASAHNVRVVNMSLGASSEKPVSRSSDPTLYDAIAKARDAGIVTVAAACNSDDDADPPFYAFPSDFDNVVSVINLTYNKQSPDGISRDSDSNYNTQDQTSASNAKNISAPGTSIYSTYNTNNSAYEWEGGTSMASPLVAGVLGLVFTVNPNLTAPQAESLLYSSAKDLTASPAAVGWDRETGYGEIDAEAAVKAAGATAASSKTDIATCRISVSDAAYTGAARTPAVKVTKGNTTLTLGKDYTLAYRDNMNAGKAAFTVKGIGNYTGIAVGSFTISAMALESVSLKSSSVVYNGKAHKPVVKKVLAPVGAVGKKNYEVTYWRGSSKTKDFTSVGVITVKVEGQNDFSGTVSAKFTIKPKGTSITKLKAAKKAITVKWSKRTKQTSGYQIKLATNKAFTKNVKTLTAKSSVTKKTVKSLKAKKKYYVKIRTYKKANGETIYSSWSKTRAVKTKR